MYIYIYIYMFYKLNDNNLIAHIEMCGCESVILLVAKEKQIR